MPRATNKKQLLDDANTTLAKLNTYLDTLTPEEWEMDGVVGEWAVKDVIAHLAEWHQMVLLWYNTGLNEKTPAVPAEGFTWRTIPDLNHQIYLKHHHRTAEDIRTWFTNSDKEAVAAVEALEDETLFTRGLYPWMNKNALGAYFVSCLSSHYTWALKEIRSGIKQKRNLA